MNYLKKLVLQIRDDPNRLIELLEAHYLIVQHIESIASEKLEMRFLNPTYCWELAHDIAMEFQVLHVHTDWGQEDRDFREQVWNFASEKIGDQGRW